MQGEPGRLKMKKGAVKEGKQREWREGVDDRVAQQTQSEEAALGCGQTDSGPDMLKCSPLGNEEINSTHPQSRVILQKILQRRCKVQHFILDIYLMAMHFQLACSNFKRVFKSFFLPKL